KDQNLRETYEIFLHFIDYIKNIKNMNELKWKLTNRYLKDGYVEITRNEAARLIEEEIQSKILEKTKRKIGPPEVLEEILENIKEITKKKIVLPPCIKKLFDTLSAGGRLSHLGRFTLTSFFVNTGASEEDIMNFFKSASDFDENKTKYQIEHISGRKGGKTKYKPPKCDTLKTHGLCFSPDEICNRIAHPLSYYKLKIKLRKKK
ncbi:MAG: DNA primase regulatory subunit PriL, partial [Candidatus Thorarchaeota archaeon]